MVVVAGVVPIPVVVAEEVDPMLEEEAVVAAPTLEVVDSFDTGNSAPASMDFVEAADIEVVEVEEVVDTEEAGVAVSATVDLYHNYHKISRLSLKEHRIWGMEPSVA
jgi:hypothetical protein